MDHHPRWPGGKTFAFSVFDDTDRATTENVGPVYALFEAHGIRTTKSVWPLQGTQPSSLAGDTCEDPAHRRWLLSLKDSGFEIGYHLNSYHSSTREQTQQGLRLFADIFGHMPCSMANHARCSESIYWGPARLTGIHRPIYNLATRFRNVGVFRGHVEGDPYFWGDLCREHITYCRNFVYPDINTLKSCPMMPYHDPARPFVNYWYASSAGHDLDAFLVLLSEESQDRLEREGGACIVYAHFASGFCEHGEVNARFRALMERLSRKNGWFVPVTTLLDHLRGGSGGRAITATERRRLERSWLRHKITTGTH